MPERTTRPTLVLLAIAWIVAFGLCFFSFDLPNNPHWNRWELWLEVPDLLWYCVVPLPDVDNVGWRFFPQRLPMIASGSLMVMAAWGLGASLIHGLGLRGRLDHIERLVFGLGLGLSGLSLITLGVGLAGAIKTQLLPFGTSVLAVVGVGHCVWAACNLWRESLRDSSAPQREWAFWRAALLRGQIPYSVLARAVAALAMSSFVLAMVLGSLLPSIDFDVKEYHLQGPKEWYATGSVHFLPHNVYTSFPFLTEMFVLQGMVLRGDWFDGALVGQLVMGLFGPLTALGVFAATRRWFGATAAWMAALIHLSTPWTYRISVIAYAEGGATFYLFAAFFAAGLWAESQTTRTASEDTQTTRSQNGMLLLCGLMAGSSMACKYPGLLSVVGPIGLALLCLSWRLKGRHVRQVLATGAIYGIGVAIAVGPWLLKNLWETGNPVYPLANNLFHGIDWTDTLDANWKRAHSPPHHQPFDILVKLMDVTLKSDWLSPLLFSLAPFAFFACPTAAAPSTSEPVEGSRRSQMQRPLVMAAWLYVGFLFASWWLLTHRIDRFWIPLIPLVSLLAGVGVGWTQNTHWRWTVKTWIALCVTFNLGFITTSNCGLNTYLTDLNAVTVAAQSTAPGIAWMNQHLPPNSKVLLVGEAQVFDARFPLVYNTVFDISIFEQWCSAKTPGVAPRDQAMLPAAEILQTFADSGITHVFVNWSEIFRYRESGYGYSDFVSRQRIDWLQREGVLSSDSLPLNGLRPKSSFRLDQIEQITAWSPELFITTPQGDAFLSSQLLTVLPRR